MIGGISVWQLLILLLIVVLVFGTKRLRNVGSDLGSAIKGFRKGMEDEPEEKAPPEQLEAEPPPAADAKSEQAETERKPGSDV